MIIDAQELPDGSLIEADLVIIGGGMAGITIARELRNRRVDVIVLESGGRGPDRMERGMDLMDETQELNRGTGTLSGPENATREIDDYLVFSRYRALGGAGNLWGGKCVPLDPWDFERRPWIPNSGWPFTREQLQPYYDRACDLLMLQHFDPDLAEREPDRPTLKIDGERNLVTIPRQHTKVTGGFGGPDFLPFKTSITDVPNIRVYLNASVTNIAVKPEGNRVDGLEIGCLNGKRHRARGRVYILVTGGIENARILLSSNDVQRDGLGNQHDLVGRYWSGHVNFGKWDEDDGPNTSLHFTRLNQSLDLYSGRDRTKTWGVLGLNTAAQRGHELPNCIVTIFPLRYEPYAPSRAVAQLGTLVDGELEDLSPEVRSMDGRHFPIHFKIEQISNPESRITLTAERDALGMRRVNLDWQFTEQDFDGLRRSIDFFQREMGRTSTARVAFTVKPDELVEVMSPARHHMGSTRMHVDPKHGVVDADCKMHGVDNLYIAGSSVFPTGGNANPTLTIVALAFRLCDHLKQVIEV